MSPEWLRITIPVAIVLAALLIYLVIRLIGVLRGAVVASVPLAAESEVAFDATGPMLLHGEGPRLSTAFRNLDFSLADVETGQEVVLSGILFKQSSSGLRKTRLTLRSFTLDTDGTYCLSVQGASDSGGLPDHSIVFTRDRRSRVVGLIVAIVFCGIGATGGLGLSVAIYLVNR